MVSISYIDHLLHNGPDVRFYELQSVAEVLQRPLVVFRGLKRDGKQNALCYVGKPNRYGENWSAPGHPDMVFMVGVTENWVVFEWGWEKMDAQNDGSCTHPVDAHRRFTKMIWKQS